jgi:hypothetical protein
MNNEELKRSAARWSPAGLAAVASRGKWKLAPHLKLLNEKLIRFERDILDRKSPRLAIFMPPRHGKSELVSRHTPPWFICRNPELRVILSSYEGDFAASWGRKSLELAQEYGPRYFDVGIDPKSRAAHEWGIAGHSGGMDSIGVGGPATGKGASLWVIDDPVKDAKQANSEVYRESTWDWYRATGYTRLAPGGGILLMMTRWHEEDLAGMILKHAREETGETWDVVRLPALAEENDPLGRRPGEALWPERYPVPDLMRIKATLGSYWWSALYGQSPMPNDGGTFKRSWLRYYRREGDLYVLECA